MSIPKPPAARVAPNDEGNPSSSPSPPLADPSPPHSTLQVYYSKGSDPLKSVTSAVTNDNSGAGQFQIGVLKKPTGTSDVVNAGYQESGLNEGLIYGSLFVEDSDNACVSL